MGPNKKPPYVFSPSEVTVQPGDTVKFIQVNSRHNVMFDSKKIKDKDQQTLFKKLSHKKLLKKKNDQIVITIPDETKPDTYDFFCTPHKSSGMKGHLIVKS
jgi:plastocyanin